MIENDAARPRAARTLEPNGDTSMADLMAQLAALESAAREGERRQAALEEAMRQSELRQAALERRLRAWRGGAMLLAGFAVVAPLLIAPTEAASSINRRVKALETTTAS